MKNLQPQEFLGRGLRQRWSRQTMMAAGMAVILVAGCNKAADTTPEPVVTVQAAHPEQGPISEHITADAVLAPLTQAALSPKISAPVRKFYVQRGSHVRAGELLATLENRDLQAAALDNEGTYTAAQATYETQTKAQVPEDYKKAQLDLTQAEANLKLNQSIVDGRKSLFAQGAIPGRDLDTATAALVQAQAAYDTAKVHMQSMQSVSHQAALRSAQGQLQSAKGKYLGAQAQVDYSQIRSPISGVVTDRPLFAGETVVAGAPLITVMDTSALLAKVHLAQPIAQRLKVGDVARVAIPGISDAVPARVSLVSPALDPGSTTVEVWLRLDNARGTFKVGTPVHVSVAGIAVQNALKVPASAIQTAQDGSKSVMVIGPDSVAKAKPVTLGIEDAGDVQILSGVTSADMIVTGGAYALADGTKVKVGAPGSDAGGDEKPAAGKGSTRGDTDGDSK
ncbi:MAG TPA: efflux RND transporter periplasmic adaptor subunit [Acidisarcina sp.]